MSSDEIRRTDSSRISSKKVSGAGESQEAQAPKKVTAAEQPAVTEITDDDIPDDV